MRMHGQITETLSERALTGSPNGAGPPEARLAEGEHEGDTRRNKAAARPAGSGSTAREPGTVTGRAGAKVESSGNVRSATPVLETE